MFFSLPAEVIRKIYEMDPVKRFCFNRVVHQIRMRQVWYEAYMTPKYRSIFTYDSMLLRTDNPWFRISEDNVEENVRFQCRWQRIHGRKPRLPFDEFDLVSGKVTMQNHFFEEAGDDFY